jgi:predicted ATP-binding protein involved in virulence
MKEPGSSDSLFFEDVPLRNAEEWLIQADYEASKSAHGHGPAIRRRDQIRELLCRVLPEVKDVRILPRGRGRPASQAEVKTPYSWVAMRDLSLGYRTLTAWMVDLASRLQERYPWSPDPLAEPAVVLVDEIDLHLHPTWQRQLIGFLSELFPNTQFIVTAHSPLVVQSAVGANIVVLRREDDEVIIDNETESIRNWRVDQILTSDLFNVKTARPPSLDALLEEQTRLLSKPHLRAKDKARLRELEERIGPLPTGQTREEIEAIELIQRAAARLQKEEG